jgi:hypothetical protein
MAVLKVRRCFGDAVHIANGKFSARRRNFRRQLHLNHAQQAGMMIDRIDS